MSGAARALRLAGHVLASSVATLRFALTRRGAVLVFTHAHDLDHDGRDRQMGPLVDRLRAEGRPFFEVTFVALDGGATGWRRNARAKRRPFVSWAALLVAGRIVGRERAARAFLALLRPAALFLIDESGSGQPLVRAARSLSIPSVGIQHGDFQPDNAQYANPRAGTVPVDVLAVWSPWFRERLLRCSSSYDASNTRVTGRLRDPAPEPVARDAGDVRVLLVSEAHDRFPVDVEPFLAALREARGIRLAIRPHPGEDAARWPVGEVARGTLSEELVRCDVAIGRASSALLEALWFGRPIVCVGADPARFVGDGAAIALTNPKDLPSLVQRLALAGCGESASPAERGHPLRVGLRKRRRIGGFGEAFGGQAGVEDGVLRVNDFCHSLLGDQGAAKAKEHVWGGAPVDPSAAVLGCAQKPGSIRAGNPVENSPTGPLRGNEPSNV